MLKSKQRTLLSCAISSVLGLGGGAAALAQDASRTSVLEEVIVTAEKRAVNIQDVPVAVSAYTSETRTLLGVNTVEDLARFTPSVAYRNDDRLAIRGVGRLTNAVGTDPAVALYSDGIFSTSMADTSTPPLFIERTEILRGPQGTLYGRNSVGGAINVISKRPTDKFEGEVRAAGRQLQLLSRRRPDPRPDHRQPALPGRRLLGEARRGLHQESVRPRTAPPAIAGWSRRRSKRTSARTPSPACATRSSSGTTRTASATRCCRTSRRSTTCSPYNGGLYYNPTFGYTGANPAIADPYTANTNRTVVGTLKDHQRIHLDFTWDLGGATLKYFGGYQEYLYHTGSDSDETPQTAPIEHSRCRPAYPAWHDAAIDLDGARDRSRRSRSRVRPTRRRTSTTDREGFYEESQRWWSNEINCLSNGEGALQWIVGLYQYDTTWDNPQHTTAHGDPALLDSGGRLAARIRDGWNGAINGHLEGESYAGFGQIDWTFARQVDVDARRALHRGQEGGLRQGLVHRTHVRPLRSARPRRTSRRVLRAAARGEPGDCPARRCR